MKKIFALKIILCALLSNAQIPTLNWVKQWGGNANDGATSFKLDAVGNFYVAGCVSGPADLDPGPGVNNAIHMGMSDIYISKFDPSGNLLWAKTQGGSDQDVVMDIVLDSLGNIFTTGHFKDTCDFDPGVANYPLSCISPTYSESYVSKLDANGNFLWAKKFGKCNGYGAYSIKATHGGAVYVTGIFEGTADFDPGVGVFNMTAVGVENAFILKLDANGNFLWAKRVGNDLYNHGLKITTDQTGNVLISGEFWGVADLDPGLATFNVTSAGMLDIFILKLDPSGNFIWAKTFGGSASDDPTNIVVSNNGNIFLSGIYGSADVDFDPGNGVYNLPFNGWVDIFYLKLDANGNLIWCKGIGGSEYDSPISFVLDASENLYISGRFRVTVDFDPGPGTYTLASLGPGADDAFMMRADVNGNLIWAAQLHGNMNYANDIAIDNSQNVYVIGNFANPTDFDPGPLTNMLMTPSGHPDAYLLKLNQAIGTNITSWKADEEQINCFPVPFRSQLAVTSNNFIVKEVELITISGKIILSKKIVSTNDLLIDAESISPGVYFFKIKGENKTVFKKVIKD